MSEKDIIILSLCETIKQRDLEIKSLKGEIKYYEVRTKELEDAKYSSQRLREV